MAVDKLVDSTQLNADLTSVANAIRAKGGTSASLAFPGGFVDAIGDIETGDGVTVSPLSVTANGTYTAPSGEAYSPVTVNVSGGGTTVSPKAVNFIDYDGTVLYSYSESDALALTDLPANPTHSGLTAQGWNWTLAQIKSQLAAMPGTPVWVGQMYITDDGKTRIYCHFETGRLAPYLGLGVNGTVTVDWGDGSSTDTLTGTSLTTAKTVQHTYSAAGDYTITLTVNRGSFAFFGVSNAAHILKKNTTTSTSISRVYANAVQRVEMGANANINNYAFNYCSSLASITIPDGVTSIGSNAFQYCYSLTSISIPDSVTSIDASAFNSCYSLTSISIPDSVTSIDANTFQSCYSLTSITIPDGVTSIGANAFNSCYSLASITIPDGVTSIGASAFRYCHSLAYITIPDGVTSIGSNAFQNCYSLASITIPDGVTSIDANAFNGCQSLMSITIPDGVTSIGGSVFISCSSLASITIPDGVTSIDANAFSSCYGLGEIHFLPTTPPTVSNTNAFKGVPTDCKIYVPAGSLAAYTSATNYPSSSTYTYIEE